MKLYFITPNDYPIEELKMMVLDVLESGVEIIQYRDKNISKEQFLENAIVLKEIVERYEKTFIINDYLDIAHQINADVHLGKKDEDLEKAKQLGIKTIGASVQTLEEANEAIKKGATYLGVGAMFTTSTKDDATLIKENNLKEILDNTDVPVYLIGGINEENCKELTHLKADGICLISAITKNKKYKENIERIRNNMYTTQMDAAKKGIITKEMEIVAKKEKIDVNKLMHSVAVGEVAIPANKNHTSLDPHGVGKNLTTKINVNLGISRDCKDISVELEKVKKAIDMKAEAIMDLSSYGKTKEFRQSLVKMSSAMIGTVPVYDAIGFYDKELKDITVEEFLDVVRKHAQDGVDFMTIHAGLTRHTAQKVKESNRLTSIVSRGGSLMYAWMELNDSENPFYEHYDELLDICREYDVTLSLGDALRPGSTHDATDNLQISELITLGELTKRAWEKDVQVMIEGPGHMSIDEIQANMLLEKKLCHNAPFYVLGPVVTDIAPGYDHITAAIGGAIAATYGADFLCYVTPAEHLRLPTLDDMVEGIIATKIAAHAADIAKKIPGARDWDNEMSKARFALDWEKMFSLALDPEKAIRYRQESMPKHEDSCTMCGKMCSMRTMKKIKTGNDLNMINN